MNEDPFFPQLSNPFRKCQSTRVLHQTNSTTLNMLVEGLAFYAAATGSLAAINILKSWIQELRQLHREVAAAQETLNELVLSCAVS